MKKKQQRLDTCTICPHPFDLHAIIATGPLAPMGGGIILCPAKDCQCFTTWQDPLVVPTQEEIDELRARIQG